MYGLVNKAAQDFIIESQGQEVWEVIKKKAGVKEDAFISMQPYSDEITYNIVTVASEHLKMDADTELKPPSFNCQEIDSTSFRFEYHSTRPGLAQFVKGLLLGLGKRFKLELSIDYLGTINGLENSHAYNVSY